MNTICTMTADILVKTSVYNYLKNTESAQFAYLRYTNENNETSTYKLLLNTNFMKLYKDDLETLKNMIVDGEVAETARQELIKSVEKAIETEFQHEKNPTKNMTTIHKAIKIHEEKNEMYLHCLCLEKKIHVPGEYKEVKSSEKTIVKNKIKKQLKQGKIRFFKINVDQIERISTNTHRILIVAGRKVN